MSLILSDWSSCFRNFKYGVSEPTCHESVVNEAWGRWTMGHFFEKCQGSSITMVNLRKFLGNFTKDNFYFNFVWNKNWYRYKNLLKTLSPQNAKWTTKRSTIYCIYKIWICIFCWAMVVACWVWNLPNVQKNYTKRNVHNRFIS